MVTLLFLVRRPRVSEDDSCLTQIDVSIIYTAIKHKATTAIKPNRIKNNAAHVDDKVYRGGHKGIPAMKAFKITALVTATLASTMAFAELPEPVNSAVKAYQACADQVKSGNGNASINVIKTSCAAQEQEVKKLLPPSLQESVIRQMHDNVESNVRM